MANMSYCRFQNTLSDLIDCENSEGMYDPEVLSDEEKVARRRLVNLCKTIAEEFSDDDSLFSPNGKDYT